MSQRQSNTKYNLYRDRIKTRLRKLPCVGCRVACARRPGVNQCCLQHRNARHNENHWRTVWQNYKKKRSCARSHPACKCTEQPSVLQTVLGGISFLEVIAVRDCELCRASTITSINRDRQTAGFRDFRAFPIFLRVDPHLS